MQSNQEYSEKEYAAIQSPFLFNKSEQLKEEAVLALPDTSASYPMYPDHYGAIHMEPHQSLHLHQPQPHDYYAEHHHGYPPYESIPHYMPHEYFPHHPPPPPEENQILVCPHDNCGKQFKKQNAYHAHLKTHVSTSAKPFLCRICSFSFSRSHDLKRHEYIHSKDKPFLCTGCQRGFSRRDALKRHLDSMKNRPGGCGAAKKRVE